MTDLLKQYDYLEEEFAAVKAHMKSVWLWIQYIELVLLGDVKQHRVVVGVTVGNTWLHLHSVTIHSENKLRIFGKG